MLYVKVRQHKECKVRTEKKTTRDSLKKGSTLHEIRKTFSEK